MNVTVNEADCRIDERLGRGLNYKSEGLYDEAVPLLQSLLEDQPDHPLARRELGLIYGFIGLFDESIAELERAVSLAPACLETRLALAKTYCMLGMDDSARCEFEWILKQEPDHEEAQKNLAFLT